MIVSEYATTKRQKKETLRSQMELERSSHESEWHEVHDFILPGFANFNITDDGRGERRKTKKIIDSTATLAARTFASNLMAGYTSPARLWFRLTTGDPELAEIPANKEWLYEVTRQMSASMLRTNLYKQLPTHYKILSSFATSVVFIEEDMDRVAHFRVLPPGTYWLANDEKGQCRFLMRKFRLTVSQIIEKFGIKGEDGKIRDWSNLSDYVKDQWETGKTETKVQIIHFVTPNENFIPGSKDETKKQYESCYYEYGASSNREAHYATGNQFLREAGYDYFPALAVRYEVLEGDSYGIDCPGYIALPDVKQLQKMHKVKAKGVEKSVDPPMIADGHMKSNKLTTIAGETSYINSRTGETGFKPAYQIAFDVSQLREDIAETQRRINDAYLTNFFLALSNDFRNQRATAREVEEIHDEKIAVIGPTLEQLNWEQSDPLIEIYFMLMLRQGRLPPPPEEIQGQRLKIEYVSVMSQAQKSIGVGVMERFLAFLVPYSEAFPSIRAKLKLDEFVDEYADNLGVSPRIVNSKEEADAIVAAEQQAIAQARQLETVQGGAKAAKDLGQVSMDEDSALTRLVSQ